VVTKPRLLALCGTRSNSEVTQMQLDNLKITQENHDIVYMDGILEVSPQLPCFPCLSVWSRAGSLLNSCTSTSIPDSHCWFMHFAMLQSVGESNDQIYLRFPCGVCSATVVLSGMPNHC
jgi:hypothetical protein